MDIKGWLIGISWGFLCSISLGLVDEDVDSEPEESSRLEKQGDMTLLVQDAEDYSGRSARIPIDPDRDDMARLTQATEDYSNGGLRTPVVEILMDHLDMDDLYPMLQVLREKLNEDDRESVIEDIKERLDAEERILEFQTLEECWERDNLPLSALSEENRKFVKECNPEGLESEVYAHLLDKLSKYLLGQQSESNATSEEDSDQEKLLKHSVTQQFKTLFTTEQLCRMNINFKKLIQIELTIALREREFTLKEEMQLDDAIIALNCSPEQRLRNAISHAFDAPKIALEIVKSIVGEGNVDVNSIYRGSSFLIAAAEIWQDKGFEIVLFLLNNGANVKINDGHGWTALHAAAQNGNIEVARLLLDHGADGNAKHEAGPTPLSLAWVHNHPEIVELLINNGAKIGPSIDTDGQFFAMGIQRRKETYDETEKREIQHYIDELRSQDA